MSLFNFHIMVILTSENTKFPVSLMFPDVNTESLLSENALLHTPLSPCLELYSTFIYQSLTMCSVTGYGGPWGSQQVKPGEGRCLVYKTYSLLTLEAKVQGQGVLFSTSLLLFV